MRGRLDRPSLLRGPRRLPSACRRPRGPFRCSLHRPSGAAYQARWTCDRPCELLAAPGRVRQRRARLEHAGGTLAPGTRTHRRRITLPPLLPRQAGASGPWPHSRYVAANGGVFTMDLGVPTTPVQAADSLTSEAAPAKRCPLGASAPSPSRPSLLVLSSPVVDDDLVGNLTVGGAFCLDLVTGGWLEVWAAPLAGGRWGAALFNRSPAPDAITLEWAALGVPMRARFAVRDVWAGADRGVFAGAYTAAAVEAHGVVLLVLTPSIDV